MATYQGHERGNGMDEQLQADLRGQRMDVESLAWQLSRHARQQWQRAIEGMVALPAAVAVGTAATALYAVSFVTRGLEVFSRQAGELREQAEEQRRVMRKGPERGELGAPERPENMPRA